MRLPPPPTVSGPEPLPVWGRRDGAVGGWVSGRTLSPGPPSGARGAGGGLDATGPGVGVLPGGGGRLDVSGGGTTVSPGGLAAGGADSPGPGTSGPETSGGGLLGTSGTGVPTG